MIRDSLDKNIEELEKLNKILKEKNEFLDKALRRLKEKH